jgi:hypothetical protein
VLALGDHGIDPCLEQVLDTGRDEYVAALALDETTARRSPASRAART